MCMVQIGIMRTFLRSYFSLFLTWALTSLSLVVTSTAVLTPCLIARLTGLMLHLNHPKQSSFSWNRMPSQMRFFNPSTKQFSFFSHVHGTFSRIDFFLIDHKLSSVTSSSHNPIVISDHATVVMDVSFPGRSLSHSPWRFISLLFADTNFISTINIRIDLFISTMLYRSSHMEVM